MRAERRQSNDFGRLKEFSWRFEPILNKLLNSNFKFIKVKNYIYSAKQRHVASPSRCKFHQISPKSLASLIVQPLAIFHQQILFSSGNKIHVC